jgi:hypothetical protein
MKTIKLPSGQKCRPRRLKTIYGSFKLWEAYSDTYKLASRLDKDSTNEGLWKKNPYIVSSIHPSDLAIYPYKDNVHPAMVGY